MNLYQLIGVFLAVDGLILAVLFGFEQLRKWVNTHWKAAGVIGSFVVAVEIVLVLVIPLSRTVVLYDFENNSEGWGEHPQNELHVDGQGVEVYCDKQSPVRYIGDCSLKFTPTEIVNRNAYVTVLKSAQGSRIKAYVFVPSGADISVSKGRSTARMIVWDKNWVSHESDYMELIPGAWQKIFWDLRGEKWPGPWREFGLHFWFITKYEGPIYIDKVTLTK